MRILFTTNSGSKQLFTICALTLFFCLSLNAQGVSVLSFGAVPDGILRTDGAMTAGSSALTSPSGTFSTADVGKYIQVIGAGPGEHFIATERCPMARRS